MPPIMLLSGLLDRPLAGDPDGDPGRLTDGTTVLFHVEAHLRAREMIGGESAAHEACLTATRVHLHTTR